MSDYIKREDAIEVVRKSSISYLGTRFAIEDAIEDIPAADVVEQKHGKWLEVTTLDNEFICWVCSECRHGADFVYEPYNFCPNCGASMRQQEETE